ncbi:MAG TPA: ABC transporter ATP-binding protein [Kiritimatiellia bacterium]|nr:ABC transporter ATP-binding protein [Kiritimatiellia bacterium]
MNHALRFDNVVKRYGRRRALDHLSLSVPAGSITGLVGSNGAGKTTLMAAAAGFLRIHTGTIDLLGQGPFHPDVHCGRLSLLPQDAELPRDATPRNLLVFYAELQGLPRSQARSQTDLLLQRVHLADRARSPIRSLSHGMRKRVMIAQCFLGQPELILLDEPLSGLDPREAASMKAFFTEERGRRTLLISSHNLHEIEQMCDYVIFVEQGRTVRQDTLDAVTGRSALLTYRFADGPAPDPSTLQTSLPSLQVDYDPATRLLTCRYDETTHTPESINRTLLPLLLQTGCNLLEIQRGQRLERTYLHP